MRSRTPGVGIVEPPTQELDPLAPVEDIGHGDQHDACVGQHVGGLADQLLGRPKVLQDVGKHDAVVAALLGLGGQTIFEIGHEAVAHESARDVGLFLRDGDAIDLETASLHEPRVVSGAAADIEHGARALGNERKQLGISRVGIKQARHRLDPRGWRTPKTPEIKGNFLGAVAVGAVAVEPLSTVNFPANREINREFGLISADLISLSVQQLHFTGPSS